MQSTLIAKLTEGRINPKVLWQPEKPPVCRIFSCLGPHRPTEIAFLKFWLSTPNLANQKIHDSSMISNSYNDYPLVNYQFAIEHGPVEIVTFPIQHGDFP